MSMTESDPNLQPPPESPLPEPEAQPPADEIVAGPDSGYRWKHLLLAVGAIVFGCWFGYDGWVKWPAENREIEKVQRDKDIAEEARQADKVNEAAEKLTKLKRHTETDLLIQKLLATVLPGFGIFWAVWTLRETRGQLRMVGNTLEAPGHPPITYENIRRIDKRKWDRKGIALLHYEHGDPPQPGILKIDDFAYERKPADEILERIEKNVVVDHTGLPV